MQTTDLTIANLNILIVDQDRHQRAQLRSILQGFLVENIRDTGDPAAAIRELARLPADLVICEMVMEPVDGLDFVRLVRRAKDSPAPDIPIIMVTGHTELERVIAARDAGVTEFLAKPITVKALHSRIASIIEHPREFVDSKRYSGPDRRRRERDHDGPERRGERGARDPGAHADRPSPEDGPEPRPTPS